MKTAALLGGTAMVTVVAMGVAELLWIYRQMGILAPGKDVPRNVEPQ